MIQLGTASLNSIDQGKNMAEPIHPDLAREKVLTMLSSVNDLLSYDISEASRE